MNKEECGSEKQNNEEFRVNQIQKIKALSEEILTKIKNGCVDANLLIHDMQKELYEILDSSEEAIQINPVIAEAYQLLQKAAVRRDGISGVPSGFAGLDKMTSGWQNSDLIVIAARPAMGKTAFVLSMINNISLSNKIPVGIFSLEMSNVQLVNRMIVNVCEIPGVKIKSGQLLPYEWQQLDIKLQDLIDAPIYVDDTPKMTIEELCRKELNNANKRSVQYGLYGIYE